jgi:hypothetical protein
VRWALLVLLFGNLALAGYLLFIDRGSSSSVDVRVLELNPEKLQHINRPAADSAPGKSPATACLEWSKLRAGELKRAQDELAKLNPGKTSVRDGVIVIVEPQSALVARITELKAGFAGTELKAVVCPAGMG